MIPNASVVIYKAFPQCSSWHNALAEIIPGEVHWGLTIAKMDFINMKGNTKKQDADINNNLTLNLS